MSQPQQQPGDGNVQPPVQQPPQVQQEQQPRQPVVVHTQNTDQLASQFSSFAQEMTNTLRGLPEVLVNSLRESSPQQQPPAQQQSQQPAQQQTAQQTQTQQHTQQPPAQQQSQQSAATRAPLRERFQSAWFGYGK